MGDQRPPARRTRRGAGAGRCGCPAGCRRPARRAARPAAAAAGRRPARGPARPAGPARRTAAAAGGRRGRPARPGRATRPRRPGRAACAVAAGRAARTRRCPARSGAGRAGSPGRPRRPVALRGARRAGGDRRPPSRVTCPSVSGCSPASARSAVVLPAPLGPSTPTTAPSATDSSTSTVNCPRRTTRCASRLTGQPIVRLVGRSALGGAAAGDATRGPCDGRSLVVQRSPQRDEDGHRHDQQHQGQHDGRVRVGLQGQVDRERHGLGPTREVAGEGDRGAELAQRPGPAQHRAGGQHRGRPAAG